MNETPTERQEAAATRRRWVTLAEVLAVLGVVIAGLTFWNGWAERRADEAEKLAVRSTEAQARARIDLIASVEDGGRRLALNDDTHAITDMAFAFPKALGIAVQRPSADPAIDVDWIEVPMLKLTDGGADDRAGRLPVLVTTRFLDGDANRTDTSIYDIVWKTEGRLLRGRTLKLEGLRLRERRGTQARLDALWTHARP